MWQRAAGRPASGLDADEEPLDGGLVDLDDLIVLVVLLAGGGQGARQRGLSGARGGAPEPAAPGRRPGLAPVHPEIGLAGGAPADRIDRVAGLEEHAAGLLCQRREARKERGGRTPP